MLHVSRALVRRRWHASLSSTCLPVVARHRRAINSKHSEIETLQGRWKEVLETVTMEQVELPTLPSSGDKGQQKQQQQRKRRGSAEASGDEDEEAVGMEVDGDDDEAGPSRRVQRGEGASFGDRVVWQGGCSWLGMACAVGPAVGAGPVCKPALARCSSQLPDLRCATFALPFS